MRLSLFGLATIAISQAPFAFVGVVPANARYWYLASIGLAWLLVGVLAVLGSMLLTTVRAGSELAGREAGPLRPSRFMLVAGFIIVALYGFALRDNLRWHTAAADEVDAVRAAVRAAFERGDVSAETPMVVAGVPDFVQHPPGVNVAQVLHWGLSDSFRPPFVSKAVPVYPVLYLEADRLLPLVRDGAAAVYRWRGSRLEALGAGLAGEEGASPESCVSSEARDDRAVTQPVGEHGSPRPAVSVAYARPSGGAMADDADLRLVVVTTQREVVVDVDGEDSDNSDRGDEQMVGLPAELFDTVSWLELGDRVRGFRFPGDLWSPAPGHLHGPGPSVLNGNGHVSLDLHRRTTPLVEASEASPLTAEPNQLAFSTCTKNSTQET